jgi:hypothetical protein
MHSRSPRLSADPSIARKTAALISGGGGGGGDASAMRGVRARVYARNVVNAAAVKRSIR